MRRKIERQAVARYHGGTELPDHQPTIRPRMLDERRTMANKDPKRRAATRRKIMDAYERLCTADPTRTVTASAVVQAAGVNRSTFYDYFDSVPDLRQAVENELVRALIGKNGSASFVASVKEALKPLVDSIMPDEIPDELLPYAAEFVTGGLVSLYALWYENGREIELEELVPFARCLAFSCFG